MSLLLGLLKEARDIYAKMEKARWFGGTFIRSQKSTPLTNLYTTHFKLMTEDNKLSAIEKENALARAILELPSAPATADTPPENGVADSKAIPKKTRKIEIISGILQLCAEVQLQNPQTAKQLVTLSSDLKSAFAENFEQDEDAKLFLFKIEDYLHVKQKELELRIELQKEKAAHKKTQEDLKLEKSQRTKHENASNETIKKLLTEMKEKEDLVDQMVDAADEKDETPMQPRSGSSYSVYNSTKGLNTVFAPGKNNSHGHAHGHGTAQTFGAPSSAYGTGQNLSAQGHPPPRSIFSFRP